MPVDPVPPTTDDGSAFLAKDGLTYANFHVNALCSPSCWLGPTPSSLLTRWWKVCGVFGPAHAWGGNSSSRHASP